jgi:hypothetical protein
LDEGEVAKINIMIFNTVGEEDEDGKEGGEISEDGGRESEKESPSNISSFPKVSTLLKVRKRTILTTKTPPPPTPPTYVCRGAIFYPHE